MSQTTYSFADVSASITGPGGSFSLSGANVADEGITVEMSGDKNTMTTGATPGGMHSLHMSNAGRIIVRLQKNSPINKMLNELYRYQKQSSAFWGQNTIKITNPVWMDSHSAASCAFVRVPSVNDGKDGGNMEWVFDSLDVDTILGDGTSTSL